MAAIEHLLHGTTTAPAREDRPARGDLRTQIGRLERGIAHLAASTYPRLDLSPITPGMTGPPRVLGLGELEVVRDALAERLAAMRRAAVTQAEAQAAARAELERMLADPAAYRGRRLTNAELGFPGCGAYEVIPRLGPVGRLAGWWQVKVSSGCPLGWGP